MKNDITAKKVYLWTNEEDIEDKEFNIHTNYRYTTNEELCKKLVEKYPGSKYIIGNDIEDISDYEWGMNKNEGEFIEVKGKIYRFLGAYRKKDNDWGWGWITPKEFKMYDEKCSVCESWIHRHAEKFFCDDETICGECFDDGIYTIVNCCGETFENEKSIYKDFILLMNGQEELNFNYANVCFECLKENNITVDIERLKKEMDSGNEDFPYSAEIYELLASKHII